jgi:hypothetical protein
MDDWVDSGCALPMCGSIAIQDNDADINACGRQPKDVLQAAAGTKDNEKIVRL